MTAGEAENPRRLMRKAYSSFVWRLMFFFIGGALCVGIVIPYNDHLLSKALGSSSSGGTAASYLILISPYPTNQKLTTKLVHHT